MSRIRKPELQQEPPRRPSRRGGRWTPRELTFTALRRPASETRRPASTTQRDEQVVPYLRMSGKWLRRVGFVPGDRVVVTTERRQILITLAPEETRRR